jgi:hypothetical protein
MDPRVATLKSRHAEIERALAIEMTRPSPDFVSVRELKRRKLRIRDIIAIRERLRTLAA